MRLIKRIKGLPIRDCEWEKESSKTKESNFDELDQLDGLIFCREAERQPTSA
jgi:hypothetical protein